MCSITRQCDIYYFILYFSSSLVSMYKRILEKIVSRLPLRHYGGDKFLPIRHHRPKIFFCVLHLKVTLKIILKDLTRICLFLE